MKMLAWLGRWLAQASRSKRTGEPPLKEATARRDASGSCLSNIYMDATLLQDECLNERLKASAHSMEWLFDRDQRLSWIRSCRAQGRQDACLRLIVDLERVAASSAAFQDVDSLHRKFRTKSTRWSKAQPSSYFERAAGIWALKERD
jgi:hypothetical protein